MGVWNMIVKFLIVFLLSLNTLNSSIYRYVIDIDSSLLVISHHIAKSQVGVVEKTNKNDGEVDKYLKVVGLGGKREPYCAAGLSWSFLEGSFFIGKDRKYIPFPMTAGSQIVYNHAKKIGKIDKTNTTQRYDLFVWRQKNSTKGHIGMVDSVLTKGWVKTIEFNTSEGNTGSQRDGGGVWLRKRNLIQPMGMLLVRGRVGFNVIDRGIKIDWSKFNLENYRWGYKKPLVVEHKDWYYNKGWNNNI